MSRALCFVLLLGLGTARAALDPTLPPPGLRPAQAVDGKAAAPLVLQSILRASTGSRAVIDGQRLRVGDSHAGARVLGIYPHGVLIQRQGRRELLRLVSPVLQPSR